MKPLTTELLPAAVELDQLCLGGLWTLEGYRRELDSPNSEIFVLQPFQPQDNEISCLEPENSCARSPASRSAPIAAHTVSRPAENTPLLGLGCFWAIVDEAHITILAIHPDYRRQGLGQALLWMLLAAAQQRELKWATLEVRVSNQAAIALYEKFGFQVAGQRKRYYQDTGEDALILWRSGLQHPDFRQTLTQWGQQIWRDRLQPSGLCISSNIPLDFCAPFLQNFPSGAKFE